MDHDLWLSAPNSIGMDVHHEMHAQQRSNDKDASRLAQQRLGEFPSDDEDDIGENLVAGGTANTAGQRQRRTDRTEEIIVTVCEWLAGCVVTVAIPTYDCCCWLHERSTACCQPNDPNTAEHRRQYHRHRRRQRSRGSPLQFGDTGGGDDSEDEALLGRRQDNQRYKPVACTPEDIIESMQAGRLVDD